MGNTFDHLLDQISGDDIPKSITDVRVDKYIKKCHLTGRDMNTLWLCFLRVDKLGKHLANKSDTFERIFFEPRTIFADSLFELIDCGEKDDINFGEFVEYICLFSIFKSNDIIRRKFPIIFFHVRLCFSSLRHFAVFPNIPVLSIIFILPLFFSLVSFSCLFHHWQEENWSSSSREVCANCADVPRRGAGLQCQACAEQNQ